MEFPEILAKSQPKVSLLTHIEDCLDVFQRVIVWKEDFIESISQKYGIDYDFLVSRLFLTVAFHDIGKANAKFQSRMYNDSVEGLESHALTSIPFIFSIIKEKPIYQTGNYKFFPELLSIVSHHSPFTKSLFEGYKNMEVSLVQDEFFVSYFELVNQKAKEFQLRNWEEIKYDSSGFHKPYLVYLERVCLGMSKNEFINDRSSVSRNLLILFKSVLHYCDWIASSENFSYEYTTGITPNIITEKMSRKVMSFKNWKEFQIQCKDNFDKNLFVQISTGQGKSEAAILWALNANKNQKILFLLPTMVTTNKMWERVKSFLGDDEIVGLSHGSAQYVLRHKEEIESEQLRKHYLYNRTFFKPVTVATVDQLIYSFFNWGYWVMTAGASYNARIIIDEIHIYDAYTFGLLLETINQIKDFNSQFAIMSASLPNVLKDEIEKILPDTVLIRDESLNELQRHVIEVSDKLIERHDHDILEYYKSGKKVLVVCNSIKKAREIFDLFSDEEIPLEHKMLYHSQFILKDKIKKENELENIFNKDGGYLAVCTQIVEVSLDIDFDVLITENAPIDAIIQRLGRVNRKGEIRKRIADWDFAKVLITKESESIRKYIYKNYERILECTYNLLAQKSFENNGNLNEADLKRLVDSIYTVENLGQRYFDELEDARGLIRKLWKQVTKNLYTLKIDEANLHKISSRKQTDYVTVECVLQKHNLIINFEDIIAEKNYDILREYIVKIPLYLAKDKNYQIKKLNESEIYLMDFKYDEVRGITFENDDNNLDFGA